MLIMLVNIIQFYLFILCITFYDLAHLMLSDVNGMGLSTNECKLHTHTPTDLTNTQLCTYKNTHLDFIGFWRRLSGQVKL